MGRGSRVRTETRESRGLLAWVLPIRGIADSAASELRSLAAESPAGGVWGPPHLRGPFGRVGPGGGGGGCQSVWGWVVIRGGGGPAVAGVDSERRWAVNAERGSAATG